MLGLDFKYDARTWLPVPTRFPDEDGRHVDAWAAVQAESARARGMHDSVIEGPLENYFLTVAEFARQQGQSHDEVWLLVAEDAPGVTALLIDVVEARSPLNDRLIAWTEPSELQYEPATVDELTSAGLGEGVLVVRHDIDPDDSSIYLTVNAVFRVRGHDVIASTQSYDVVAVNAALPYIRQFLDNIRPIDQAVQS